MSSANKQTSNPTTPSELPRPARRTAAAGFSAIAAAAIAFGLAADQLPAMFLSLALTAVAAVATFTLGGRRPVVLMMLALAAMSMFRVYYVVSGPFDLSGDEAQYWDWSRRMDWSYVTKGPGVAAFIWAGRQFFGETVLAVRGPAVVLAFGSTLLLFALGKRLSDEKTGVIAAAIFQVVPIFAMFSVGMNTDPPLIFFWLASLLAMHKGVTSRSVWPWLLLGLTVGLGILSKYTMVAFGISALGYLLTRPEGRERLRTPWPYAAVMIAAICSLPVLYWNWRHGWVNFAHNSGHVVRHFAGLGEIMKTCSTFVGSQLGAVSPILLVLMLIAAVARRKVDGLSFWFSAPLFALFVLKSVQGEVLPNWALTVYLTGLVAFAAYYLRDWARWNKHVRRTVVAAVVIAVVCTVLLQFPMQPMSLWRTCAADLAKLTGIKPHNLGADANPMKKVRGWRDLAGEVDRIRSEMRQPYFICSDKYPIASCLAFYLKDNPRTHCLYQKRGASGRRLERRINNFDIWEQEERAAGRPTWGDMVGQDVIFVTDKPEENQTLPSQLQAVFSSWEKIVVEPKDPYGYGYVIFVCRNFKGLKVELPTSY